MNISDRLKSQISSPGGPDGQHRMDRGEVPRKCSVAMK